MKKTIIPALGALSLMLAGCGAADEAADPVKSTATAGSQDLASTIAGIDDLSTAAEVIGNAGLEDPFDGAGSYTAFLPSNAAFAALPEGDLERLRSDEGRPEVIALLRGHLAVGAISREDLDRALDQNGGSIELASVADEPIQVRKIDGQILVGDGDDAPHLTKIAEAASNGVVYVIDGFIPPEN